MTEVEFNAILEKKDLEIERLERENRSLEDENDYKDDEISSLEKALDSKQDTLGDREDAAMRALLAALPDPSRENYEQFEFRRNLRIIFDALHEANRR